MVKCSGQITRIVSQTNKRNLGRDRTARWYLYLSNGTHVDCIKKFLVHRKFIKLIKIRDSEYEVLLKNSPIDSFAVSKELSLGDPSSILLLNFVLQKS